VIIESFSTAEVKNDIDKNKREALQKVKVMRSNNELAAEYLQDLETAIKYDAISGYYLREINRLKKAELKKLPEIVTAEYIQDILRHYNEISFGNETVIVTEEFQNILEHPQTEIV
jgi:hypothetical protein